MSGGRRVRGWLAGAGLFACLALGGCGVYGPPSRTGDRPSRPEPAAPAPDPDADEDDRAGRFRSPGA